MSPKSKNRDITERRQIEQALRESEERNRTLLEAMIQGVVCQDAEGNIVSANPAAERILGYTIDQMRGRTFTDLHWRVIREDGSDFPGKDHPSMVASRNGENVENVIMGIFNPLIEDHKWVNVNAMPQFREGENKPYQIYTVFDDITERKMAEEVVLKSEERYRILFELCPDAILVWQGDKVIQANSAAMRLLGATALDQLVGITFWEILPPEYYAQRKERYETVFKTERTLPPAEYQLVRLDGQKIYVEATTTLIQYRNQRTALSVYRDITERKLFESEKLNLEAQLQQAQKMEAIGTLAGGIAHDFNNILSAVIGYSEIAIKDAERETLVYESLSEVLKAGDRAKNLVNQILTFSRQTEHESKPVQVKIIMNEVLKLLRASLPATIEIRSYLQSQSAVMADPTHIHQIVMNLCTNAYHAMRETGGLMEVRLEDVRLGREDTEKHPELRSGSYIKIAVSDTGQGMEPYVLERIFNPFYTTKEKGEGTGMGLSVVHGIVKNGGGSIFVQSEPGKGSCFEILFPVIEKVKAADPTVGDAIPTGTEKVLFVDDEKAIADLNRILLESLGYEVTTRTSPIEALELFKFQSDRFDIVITDMTMPKMTGRELAEHLHRIKPDIPIILCTGFSTDIDENRAASMGISALIYKPILSRDIAQAIRNALDNKKDTV